MNYQIHIVLKLLVRDNNVLLGNTLSNNNSYLSFHIYQVLFDVASLFKHTTKL
jgi:hypothetical protein